MTQDADSERGLRTRDSWCTSALCLFSARRRACHDESLRRSTPALSFLLPAAASCRKHGARALCFPWPWNKLDSTNPSSASVCCAGDRGHDHARRHSTLPPEPRRLTQHVDNADAGGSGKHHYTHASSGCVNHQHVCVRARICAYVVCVSVCVCV